MAVAIDVAPVHEEHGDPRAIGRWILHLAHTESFRVDVGFHAAPES
jgi:hypothetical protein